MPNRVTLSDGLFTAGWSVFSLTTLALILAASWAAGPGAGWRAARVAWLTWAALWFTSAVAASFLDVLQRLDLLETVVTVGEDGLGRLLLAALAGIAAMRASQASDFGGAVLGPVPVGIVAAVFFSPWTVGFVHPAFGEGSMILTVALAFAAAQAALVFGCGWIAGRERVVQFAEDAPKAAWMMLAGFFVGSLI